MVIESTQPENTGKPAPSVSQRSAPEGEWSDHESSHKELMRLEDRDPSLSAGAAAPTPPGDTKTPPPGKGAKTLGAEPAKPAASDGKATPAQQQPAQPGTQQQGQSAKPQDAQSGPNGNPKSEPGKDKAAATAAPPRPVSEAKVKMKDRLPALTDDGEIGKEKEQTVAREGKADLGFTGTLLGSAASSAPKGEWQELRIYSTSSGKHVFSRVTRTIYADENDKHEADVYDPSPSSVPSQLLRSAREMTRSKPMTWMDGAVAFFGYDPLAKVLYRKLSVEFEEQI